MPTELDSLQLNITAKTSDAIDSIKKLMTQLEFLGQRIGVFNTLVESSGKVENLSKSIDLMNKSVTEFNVPQLEQMAKAMKSFARSAQKIGTVKGFGTMSESALRSNEAIHKLAVGFASTLGVEGKESVEAVESELSKFFELIRTNKDPDFTPFVTSMKEIAIQAEATKNQTLDSFKQFQEVRRWLSTSNIYLPEKFASEFGKDYSHVRGVIGIRNTTSDKAKGTGLNDIMGEMNSQLGTTFKLGETDVNLFHQLYDYMEKNNGKAEALARNFYSGSENASKLNNTIHGVIDDMYSLERASEALKENVSTVDSSPIQQITDGLSALGGINVDNAANIKLVADAVAKIGSGKNIEAASASLPKVAQGLKDFAGIQLPNWTNIAEFTSALRGLGSKSVNVASQSLNPLAEGLRKFEGLTIPNVAEIRDLASAIAIFGRKTSQEAVNVIPKLASSMNGLFITLSKSPTVSRNVIDLTNALGTFLANLKGVSTQSKKASNDFKILGNSAKHSSKKMFSLASAIGKIYATYFLLFRFIRKIKDAIDISSSLKEVQNVVDTTFGKLTSDVEEFATSAVENFGMSELSAKQYASRFQAMAVAMGIPAKQVEKAQKQLNSINPTMAERGYNALADSMADMSINVTKLAADMASFYNVEQADVAKDLEAIYTGMTRPLRQYGLDLTEATLREWAMKNGLDADIKSMTQAEKTLLRYQYVMANTSAAQGDFAKTSMTWANQIRMLKQNFERLGAVIGSGFIAWLRPMVVALNNAMNGIIATVQKTVNALGKIFGWEMIIDTTGQSLIDDTEEVADAWDDATGAAKKYAKQLLGIDEINNLTTNDGGRGSGDDDAIAGISGGNLIKPGGIEFKKFESDISTLFQLGDKIADKLKKMMDGIDWDEVYEGARNFGKGLADFLNGLINPGMFESLGKTIAGTLNRVIYAALSFGENADWKKYGTSISKLINGFVGTVDVKSLASAINKLAKGILEMFTTAIKKTNWKQIGKTFGTFISNIDWLGILKGVVTLIWEALKASVETFSGLASESPLAALIIGGLGVKAISPVLSSSLTLLSTFGNGFSNIFNGFVKSIKIFRSNFITTFRDSHSDLQSFGSGLKAVGDQMSPLGKTLTVAIAGIGEFMAVSSGISNLVTGTGDLITNLGEIALGVGGAGLAFTAVFGFPGGLIATAVVGVTGLIKGFADGISELNTGRVISTLTKEVEGLSFTLGDLKTAFENQTKPILDNLTSLSEKFDELSGKKEVFEDVSSGIDLVVSSLQYQTNITTEEMDKLASNIANLKSAWEDYITSSFDYSIAMAQADMEYLRSQNKLTDEEEQKYLRRIALLSDEKNAALENSGVITESMQKLIDQFNNQEISMEDLQEGWRSLSTDAENLGLSFSTSTSEIEESTKAIKDLVGQLDLSGESISDYKDMNIVVGDTVKQVGEVYKEVSDAIVKAQQEADEAAKSGSDTQRQAAQDHVNILKQQKQDLDEATSDIADILQKNYVDKGKEVIENALTEYDNMGWMEKTWNNLIGVDKQDYAKEQFKSFANNVISSDDGLVGLLNSELGMAEDKLWIDDFLNSFYDSVFESTDVFQGGTTMISDNIAELYNQELEKIPKKIDYSKLNTEETGKYITQGIITGMSTEIGKSGAELAKTSAEMIGAIDKSYGIASPAKSMNDTGKYIVAGIVEGMGLYDFIGEMNKWWKANVEPWFSLERWTELGTNIRKGLINEWNEFTKAYKDDAIWEFITKEFGEDTWVTYGSNAKNGIWSQWQIFTSDFMNDGIWKFIQDHFSQQAWTFTSIADGLKSSFEAAWEAIKQGWNGFADWLETRLTLKFDDSESGKVMQQLFKSKEAKLIKLQRYATGGFPDQGSLFVAGETYGQSEWVGNINGKTGVTSGYEITGIANAIYDTSAREMELLRQQNDYLMGILNKEFGISRDAVGEASRSYARDYYKRTGNQAYSF